MTFDSLERSVDGSAPRELWKIVTSAATYRVTTSESAIVFSLDSQTYSPIAGARSELIGATVTDPSEMELQLPAAHAIVLDNAFGMPPDDIDLTIYRLQGAAYVTWYQGKITSFTVEGDVCSMRSPSSLGDALDAQVPSIYAQKPCNRVLYSPDCTVDRNAAANKLSTTVSGSPSGTMLTLASGGSHGDQWFRFGEVVLDSTGERRFVKDQRGAVLQLDAPFRAISSGNAVTVYAGCSRKFGESIVKTGLTVTTFVDDPHGCKPKFNNAVNFGGHPHMSPVNPFRGLITGWPWRGGA